MHAPNPVARRLFAPGARQRHRELAGIDHEYDRKQAELEGTARLQVCGMLATMHVNAIRREAERVAPDGAELYAMLAVAGAVEMANIISGMRRPGRRV